MTREHPCPPAFYTWWVARAEEGPWHDTRILADQEGGREAAIEEALATGHYEKLDPEDYGEPPRASMFIIPARRRHHDLSRWFCANEWLQRIADDMDDDGEGGDEDGENGPLDDLTSDDIRSLEASVRSAIWHWQHRRQLPLRAFFFDADRPAELVETDLPEGRR